eukprot:SAG31_NODE_1284_length_9010_cov_56.116934_3_plen_96_part_00
MQCAKRWCHSHAHLIKEHHLSADAKQDLESLALIDEIENKSSSRKKSDKNNKKTKKLQSQDSMGQSQDSMGRSVTDMFGSLDSKSDGMTLSNDSQ